MSKELEALENIKHYDSRVGLHEEDYELIISELKKVDELKWTILEQHMLIQKQAKILQLVKEHLLYDVDTEVLQANFQWHITDKETQKLLEELFKDEEV